ESRNVDIDENYSREFYLDTLKYATPKDVLGKPKTVASVILKPDVFHINFTHDTRDINEGPIKTKYVELDSMTDKLNAQLQIARKIRAVDADRVAEAVLSKHFFRDIKGNLRTFSRQKFRCVSCPEKYRRPPLSGRCLACGSRLLMTVSEGAVKKYIEPSRHVIDEYKVSSYVRQQFSVLEDGAENLFGKRAKQLSLARFNAG
ncbi:MAG: DNA polymerase II large subunit, partial [Candidatus Aenigmarchaeota archaeon]|nr:DNA polymerase II large subunit [Candidatus Aenigmarchaeota archaeon]